MLSLLLFFTWGFGTSPTPENLKAQNCHFEKLSKVLELGFTCQVFKGLQLLPPLLEATTRLALDVEFWNTIRIHGRGLEEDFFEMALDVSR